MNDLVLALYAEGSTEKRFMTKIIQRTTQQLVAQRGRTVVDVLDIYIVTLEAKPPTHAEAILAAARSTMGYHALIVHVDADYPSPERALKERIQPGFQLAKEAHLTHELVPLIPVQMTEAWMLADSEALREIIGTTVSASELCLPENPQQVESFSEPKSLLRQVIQRALADQPRRRRRQFKETMIYEPLAQKIRLEKLQLVPSYQHFVRDMGDALISLHMIEEHF